ncbi:DUF3900 domain-containing protein [Peribacillus alkalitolerans]|uniref:DUF3900 domain-containing protein n=1 Tax=Peribacillus alkalitolerans TaxID=1550385 RepID=UPI0013D24C8F|nr:DUF3900 domain-containing protein [Peribacillus alkalitolerans]
MDFQINFLSFYLIQSTGKDEGADKTYKHFQTLDHAMYESSSLKEFLDGEFTKITKRKVERHPKSEVAPTKIGRFIVEEGYALDSNPNYNMFQKVRMAASKEDFQTAAEKILKAYIDTSSVRGGALIIANAKLTKFYDDPFLFVLKCDFEPKVATISDEKSLIKNVEMAITTKSMKSIQYPYMPEEGMLEESELKLHQSSQSRYFEEFLKFVEYGESMPEIVKSHVISMVRDQFESIQPEDFDQQQLEEAMEIWAASDKREIQEHFEPEQIMEATAQLAEFTPEAELKIKMDHVAIKGLLSDYGDRIHLAKSHGKYFVLIESDSITFEKNFSPIEFVKPHSLEQIINLLKQKHE